MQTRPCAAHAPKEYTNRAVRYLHAVCTTLQEGRQSAPRTSEKKTADSLGPRALRVHYVIAIFITDQIHGICAYYKGDCAGQVITFGDPFNDACPDLETVLSSQ
jgi:hypothetical protein